MFLALKAGRTLVYAMAKGHPRHKSTKGMCTTHVQCIISSMILTARLKPAAGLCVSKMGWARLLGLRETVSPTRVSGVALM